MINKSSMNRKMEQTYLNEYYNIKGLYSNLMSGGLCYATSCIINALIEGLNTFGHLPKYLIVIPDLDVIKDVKEFDYGVFKALSAIMNWLTRQIDIAIRRKRLQLMEKKPGAVKNSDPTIIYVNAIHRVEFFRPGSKLEAYCSIRTKFNDILNACAARQEQHILTIRSCFTLDHFDQWGKLTTKGKSSFWIELDDLMERFEKREIKLLPRPMQAFPHRRRQNRKDVASSGSQAHHDSSKYHRY